MKIADEMASGTYFSTTKAKRSIRPFSNSIFYLLFDLLVHLKGNLIFRPVGAIFHKDLSDP
jgi:hypothetical protein